MILAPKCPSARFFSVIKVKFLNFLNKKLTVLYFIKIAFIVVSINTYQKHESFVLDFVFFVFLVIFVVFKLLKPLFS